MGVLLRRVLDGHERVAEWSPDDAASIDDGPATAAAASSTPATSRCAAEDDDNEPVTELPVDAEAVILTMPMGGG